MGSGARAAGNFDAAGGGGNASGAGGASNGTGGTSTIETGGSNAGGTASVDGGGGAASRVDSGAPGAVLGKFTLTYYWVTTQTDFTGASDTTIYDPSCAVLATVPSAFAGSLDVEGTGRLSDGRVINVDGPCSCARSPCYAPVDAEHPWGYGVQDRALVPFRSVAVDPTVIAYGTHLYIRELDGVTMPGDATSGGFVHDGCVSADDTGGDIVGAHVDFFAALESNYRILDAKLGLTSVTVANGGARCP